jgi:hypothetical protein
MSDQDEALRYAKDPGSFRFGSGSVAVDTVLQQRQRETENEKLRAFMNPPATAYEQAQKQTDERLRAIEAKLAEHREFINDMAAALKNRITELAEQERVKRWHESRDAAITGYLSNAEGPKTDVPTLLELAEQVADEAHGPLEAKLGQFHDVNGDFAREVNALVKAARGMVPDMDDATDGLSRAERTLIAALKPFEGL